MFSSFNMLEINNNPLFQEINKIKKYNDFQTNRNLAAKF